MTDEILLQCPMCGAQFKTAMEVCASCGEPFGTRLVADEFQVDPELVRKYHQQTRVLSGMWFFFGILPILFGGYWFLHLLAVGPYDGGFIFWLILFGLYFIAPGLIVMILGAIVRKKKRSGLGLSLLAGYLLLLFCLATGFTLPIIPGLLTVVMSHACFHTSQQMRNVGIPLDTPIPD